MARKPKPTTFTRVRSAVTGRFVPKSKSKASKRTTVTERFQRSSGKRARR